jgi:hypothetical protein
MSNKPQNVILAGSARNKSASNPSNPGNAGNNKPSAIEKIISSFNKAHPFFLFLIAIVLAIVIRMIAGALLAGTSLGFVWQELLKTLFVILILSAYSVLSSKGGAVGIAVIILAIILMISNIARHDYSDSRSARRSSKANVEQGQRIDQSKVDFLRLGPGTHIFELEAGEETPWRGSPSGRTNACGYSSESYDYTIIFSDGTSYPGGPSTVIPEKKNLFWKVRAHSQQTLYVTIL